MLGTHPAAFIGACHDRWWRITAALQDCKELRIAHDIVATTTIGVGERTLTLPAESQDTDDEIAEQLRLLADAEAWRAVAVDTRVEGGQVFLALHRDQSTMIPIHPQEAVGGLELLRWLLGEGPNREESLRFELRRLTASRRDALPDARTVRLLAEHRRVALSHDNAEAVHRAVADGHREAVRSVRSAATEVSRQIELSARNAAAAVVAVLGLIGLLARAGLASVALVVPVVVVSCVALVLTAQAGLARVTDAREQLDGTRERIEKDRLLPNEDRDQILRQLRQFDFYARATSTQRKVWSLTGLAIVAVIGVAFVVASPSGGLQNSVGTENQRNSPTPAVSKSASDSANP